jgi:[acyl-carrier-protein] S-malonyltransferase
MTQWAVVFPGQGSQTVGMLADIASQHLVVQQTYAEASDALGFDLWHMTLNGPASALDQTENTQPALLAGGVAIHRILMQRFPELNKALLAGHSLGEYTALVCAGALSFSDAIQLVAARGRFMQVAVPAGTGAMAAIIGLDEASVLSVCEAAKMGTEVLSPANYNSIGQIVIAGDAAAVERALVLAKEKGAKMAVPIPVSVPSHCALMQPAAEQLAALLEKTTINTPKATVFSNVDVTPYTTETGIRDGLVRQLVSPVRWVETVQAFQAKGVTHVIECGPGKVLTGLMKRIDKSLTLLCTADLSNLNAVLTASVGA